MIPDFHMTAHNRQYLHQQIDRLDCTNSTWSVAIRPYKSKRSLDQNRRLWELYTALGEFLGLDKDEVHQLMGYKFLRYQKDVGGKVEEFIKSTTKLNTKDMAEYQEAIERWASQLGFVWEYHE